MDMVKISVNRMTNFMEILLPILLTLLVATGGAKYENYVPSYDIRCSKYNGFDG